ncbi:MAG TPA: DUF1800 domain-containing protein [Opitutaceae bacterium]|nr:DUF1800 domain-containing protein [Opitutaceae bacterium]
MNVTRRQFMVAGAGAVVAAGSGCSDLRDFPTNARRWLGQPTAPPLEGLLTPPAASGLDAAAHAINRMTFGARPGDHRRVSAMGLSAFIEEQLAPARLDDWLCTRVIRHEFESLADPESRLFPRQGDAGDPLQQIFPAMKDKGARVSDLYEYKDKVLLADLTRATVLRAVLSERQLFEVMVHFWSDHFNIDPSKAECKWLKPADDRDVIRAHALGNFRTLLRASAVSPAMLWYLDGRVNRRATPADKPNENYARELLELHTLGVHGGYTQQDVIEVARCLTGWTVRDRKKFFKGRVEFNARQHDDGPKRVLGTEIPAGLGARDLDRVLEILVAHPNTARYIAWKLCRRFIADDPPVAAVQATATAFASSHGDIPATLRALFATAEFLDPRARGGKLKRPFHFVVSALRATNAETDASRQLVDYLIRLGHAPFRYATPDGYPEEASHWQSTLLWRWNFATALAANRIKGTQVAADVLRARVGGDDALMATLLGRQPTTAERAAYHGSGSGLALLVASPAFQRC